MKRVATEPDYRHLVLSPAGDGVWRVLDDRFPHADARCLIAYVERSATGFIVLSLIPPLGGALEVTSLESVVPALRKLIDESHPFPHARH